MFVSSTMYCSTQCTVNSNTQSYTWTYIVVLKPKENAYKSLWSGSPLFVHGKIQNYPKILIKKLTKNIPLKLKTISLVTISVVNLIKCGIMYVPVFQIIVYLSSPSIYGSRCLFSLILFYLMRYLFYIHHLYSIISFNSIILVGTLIDLNCLV